MMGLGMGEIMLILVIALMVFGPRKLPELGKSLGQAMNQFRKASDEFKRTWEQEVEYDKVRTDGSATTTAISSESSYSAESDYQYGYDTGYDGVSGSSDATASSDTAAVAESAESNTIASSVEKKAEPQWI